MDNKELLGKYENEMKEMYSSEKSHLIKGMINAILIEVVVFGILVGVGYLLSLL